MVSSSARVESSVWGTGRRKAVRAVRPWASSAAVACAASLVSYPLLGRGEVHGVRAPRRWVAWGEREIVGVWVCGEVERPC